MYQNIETKSVIYIIFASDYVGFSVLEQTCAQAATNL